MQRWTPSRQPTLHQVWLEGRCLDFGMMGLMMRQIECFIWHMWRFSSFSGVRLWGWSLQLPRFWDGSTTYEDSSDMFVWSVSIARYRLGGESCSQGFQVNLVTTCTVQCFHWFCRLPPVIFCHLVEWCNSSCQNHPPAIFGGHRNLQAGQLWQGALVKQHLRCHADVTEIPWNTCQWFEKGISSAPVFPNARPRRGTDVALIELLRRGAQMSAGSSFPPS